MAINRLAVSNPGATTDTLLHTATRNALVSVIATNTTTASVKTRIWVVPTGQDATPANWAYLSYDSDITGTNSLETFRFPIETGDKVYVRSNVSGISYSLNAVYEVVGNSYIFAQTGEPNAPTVGDIWVDTDNVANELNTNDYLLKADASAPSGYLLKTDAASTYETQADAALTYATKADFPAGVWQSYTPSWGSNGTQPVLNNGTIDGSYCRFGNTVHVRIYMSLGSTSTVGTGARYSWTLPVSNNSLTTCNLIFFDSSANAYYIGIGRTNITNIDFVMNQFGPGTLTGASLFGAASPVVPASGDFYILTATYEAA